MRKQSQVLLPVSSVILSAARSFVPAKLQKFRKENGDDDGEVEGDPAEFSAVEAMKEFLEDYKTCPTGGGNKKSDKEFPNR